MVKDKINNLMDFSEYSKLGNEKLKKSTKRTEVGGDVLNENVEIVNTVAALVNDAAFMNQLKTFADTLAPAAKSKLLKLFKKAKKEKK
jgi:hypothetical protein